MLSTPLLCKTPCQQASSSVSLPTVLVPRNPFPRCSSQGFPILSLPWEGPSGEQPVPGAIPHPSAHTWEPELLGGTLLPAAPPPPSKPAPLLGAQQPVPSKEPPSGSSNKSTTQIVHTVPHGPWGTAVLGTAGSPEPVIGHGGRGGVPGAVCQQPVCTAASFLGLATPG